MFVLKSVINDFDSIETDPREGKKAELFALFVYSGIPVGASGQVFLFRFPLARLAKLLAVWHSKFQTATKIYLHARD